MGQLHCAGFFEASAPDGILRVSFAAHNLSYRSPPRKVEVVQHFELSLISCEDWNLDNFKTFELLICWSYFCISAECCLGLEVSAIAQRHSSFRDGKLFVHLLQRLIQLAAIAATTAKRRMRRGVRRHCGWRSSSHSLRPPALAHVGQIGGIPTCEAQIRIDGERLRDTG